MGRGWTLRRNYNLRYNRSVVVDGERHEVTVIEVVYIEFVGGIRWYVVGVEVRRKATH